MSDREELDVGSLSPRRGYSLLTASLIPRPIAWVSTCDPTGADNLAPHSFTTVAGVDPPTVAFTSIGTKDTLHNCRLVGEFVLSIGGEHLLAEMNHTGTSFPATLSEFDAAGLAREASRVVRPPRVAQAPIAMECRVSGEHVIGESVMVFGEVVHIAVDRRVLADDGLPDPRAVAPLARLGRDHWSTLGRLIDLPRVRLSAWDRGERSTPTDV